MNRGIKRLMIVASAIWIVAGGLWTRGIVIDQLGRIARSNYSICLDGKDISGCSAQFYREWERDVNAAELNGENAVYTLGPLLLVWIAAYLLAWTTRWVVRGFKEA